MGYAKITTGSLTGFVTWVLETYVPAFHHGIPTQVAAFLPAVVGLLAVFLKKEKNVVAEGEALIARAEVAAQRVEQGIARVEAVVNQLVAQQN